eukprot:sb/3470727/
MGNWCHPFYFISAFITWYLIPFFSAGQVWLPRTVIYLHLSPAQDEMLDRIVLPTLVNTHLDPHPKVRYRAQVKEDTNTMATFCFTKINIVNIILKVVSVVVQQKDENESILLCDELIKLFINKVSKPPSRHALFLFEGLVKLATGFYSTAFKPYFVSTAKIRQRVSFVPEPTETSIQPIRGYLGHVTAYQPITDQYS